jgi:hypothetical protein
MMKLQYGSSRFFDSGLAGLARFELSHAPAMEARQNRAR